MSKKQKSTGKPPSFEKAMERLEFLVEEMESGNPSLDTMITYFEEGSALVKSCEKKLNDVEQKIDKLVKSGDEIVQEPYHQEETDGDQA
jgi:exodeoxyribonuclease VII small subunit